MYYSREPCGYSRRVIHMISDNDVSNRKMHYSREPCGYSRRVMLGFVKALGYSSVIKRRERFFM